MIIEKNTSPEEDESYEYLYYIAKIQRRFIMTKRWWFDQPFPDHEVIVEIDDPNYIDAFNRFEKEGNVQRFQCHFRLVDLVRDALYAVDSPTIHD